MLLLLVALASLLLLLRTVVVVVVVAHGCFVVVKAWLAEFDDFVVTQCEEWARKYCMQPKPEPEPEPELPLYLSLSVCWAATDFQIS